MAAGDLIICSGFEAGGDPVFDGFTAQTVTGGTITESATQKRTGSYAMRINRTASSALSYRLRISDTPGFGGAAFSQVSGSFWFYLPTLPTAADAHIADITTNQGAGAGDVRFYVDTAGQVKLGWGGQAVINVGSPVSTGVWHQFEFQVDYSTTTWTCAVRLDGGTTVNGVSKTGQVADNSYGLYEIGDSTTSASRYDVYIDDLIYIEGLSWIGNYKIETIKPDSAAAEIDTTWTIGAGSGTRAAVIDETPGAIPNDVTDYIQSSTANQVQRVETTTYTLQAGESIKGLMLYGRLGSTAATARACTPAIQNAAGTDLAASGVWDAAINGWKGGSRFGKFLTAPGAVAWSQAQLNAIRFKLTHDATTNLVRVTAMWAYVAILIAPVVGVSEESWNAVPI